MKPRVLCVCGTRPDAIKMAPVVLALRSRDDIDTRLVVSGQHREMLAQALGEFGLQPDEDFAVMRERQSLAYVTSNVLSALDDSIVRNRPHIVVGQGDTTTTFAAALASFYLRVPFGHVEAGLRTATIDSPFPEEFNRRATGQIASMHFAPTRAAADNLLNEGISSETVYVTGNTSIDAVLSAAERVEPATSSGRRVLVTTHRRENWGEPMRAICRAIRRLAESFPDVEFVLPMHKNEAVREVLRAGLGDLPAVSLIEPPGYTEFVGLMKSSYLVLTDSGGVQEEAPSLGVPALVLRSETERPEGLASGNARLVGTEENAIFQAASTLLRDGSERAAMATAQNPYGDGRASERIVSAIARKLGLPTDAISEFQAV